MDIEINELFIGSLRLSTPLMFGALGGLINEKAGIVNIAIEGMMLSSAFSCVSAAYLFNNIYLGILSGLITGLLFGLFLGIGSITFKGNQIIIGLALNIFSLGLTQFFCLIFFNSSSNSPVIMDFNTYILSCFAIILSLFIFGFLKYSLWGLRLKACGENEEASEACGIRVNLIRYIAVMISGSICGLGGIFLALEANQFVKVMTAGRGFIALAAIIFGRWHPIGIIFACFLFGFTEKLQMELRFLPPNIAESIPYLLTILILIISNTIIKKKK